MNIVSWARCAIWQVLSGRTLLNGVLLTQFNTHIGVFKSKNRWSQVVDQLKSVMEKDASLLKSVPQQNFKSTHACPLWSRAANEARDSSQHRLSPLWYSPVNRRLHHVNPWNVSCILQGSWWRKKATFSRVIWPLLFLPASLIYTDWTPPVYALTIDDPKYSTSVRITILSLHLPNRQDVDVVDGYPKYA